MMPYIHFEMHDTLSKTCGGGVGWEGSGGGGGLPLESMG